MPKIKRRRYGTDEREDEEEPADKQEEEKLVNREFVAASEGMSLNPVPPAQRDAQVTRPLHPEEVRALISEFDGSYDAAIWIRKVEHYQKL